MHEIIHAFHAALLVRAIGMIDEAADHQFALEIAGLELAQLRQDVAEFLFGLRKGSTWVSSPLASIAAMVLSCPSRSPLICNRLSRLARLACDVSHQP